MRPQELIRWVTRMACAVVLADAVPTWATNPIWISPMSAGTPMDSRFLGDTLGDWYVNFEIGQTSWNYAQIGVGTNTSGADYNWGVANWYEDVGDNRRVRRNLSGYQFTAVGKHYVICQAKEGPGDTYTSKSGNGWSNSIAYPPADLASAYFNCNALTNPTSPSAVTNAVNPDIAVNLAWTKWSSRNVMVVRRAGASVAWTPSQGTAYGNGQDLGDNTVVVLGSSSSGTHTNTGLMADTAYYYKFYSENYQYYSPGAEVSVTTASTPSPELAVGPTVLTFSLGLGGTPPPQTFGVTNIGGGTLVYTNTISYGSAGGWLTVLPTNASLAADAVQAHTASVSQATQTGTFVATNTLSGNQANGDQTVVATLTVTNLPNPVALSASDIGPAGLTVNWTKTPFDVMVVRRQGAVPDPPSNGTAYAHNETYGTDDRNQVIYAHGSGSSDTDAGLSPRTVYRYGFFSENGSYYSSGAYLSVTTLAGRVDGVADEWVGIPGTVVNASTISSNEFIWRDKAGEQRNDSGAPSNTDILEFRMRADDSIVYFYVKYSDITDVAYPYIAIGVDTDRDTADTAMTSLADDSGTGFGDGYYTNGNAALHYPEHNIIVHTVDGVGQRIELYADDGSSWYAPPTLGNDQAHFNGASNFIEFAVARADLGLSGNATGRFTVAGYFNNTLLGANKWANDGDTTAAYATTDAQDSLTVLRHGDNDGAGNRNAWDEDLSDGDIDVFFDVRFDADGLADNEPPDEPVIVFPADQQIIEPGAFSLNWEVAEDAEGPVTGYFVEMSTNSGFNGGENFGIRYRANTPHDESIYAIGSAPVETQFHWRVRSRDLGGALSGYTTTSFTISGADDDIQGPVPTLKYIGTTYSSSLIQTNITDEDLANTNDLVDIAVIWTDLSGVFLTNAPPYPNTNIGSGDGRVISNWDLYTTNTESHGTVSFGYDEVFDEFVGVNGGTTVTTVYENAFAVTNITFKNLFFLTVSAEDEDNDRGTYPDPQGDGDPVPHDRAVTTNYMVQFAVVDDDTAWPEHTSFNIADAVYTNWDLGVGLTVTGLVQDYSGVYGGDSNRFVLYRNGTALYSGAFTTRPETDGTAKADPEPLAVTLPPITVTYTGTYQLAVIARDYDHDRPGEDDTKAGTNVFTFAVVPPPPFDYKMKVSVSAYNRNEALTNFPTLILFSEGLTNFLYSQFASSVGADLRFYDASERALLNHQIETWNTNGTSTVWVQIPRLTNGTTMWACWGNDAMTDPPATSTNGATWSADYAAVFHLHATNGTTAFDSTANNEHGTLRNMDDTDWTTAQIANGLDFDGANDSVSNEVASWSGPYTVLMWARTPNTNQAAQTGLFHNKSDGFQIEFDDSTPRRYRYAGGANIDIGPITLDWTFMAVTFMGTTTRTYLNGLPAASASDARDTFTRYDIGADRTRASHSEGLADEVRISSVARSSNWIWACWMTQASNTPFQAYEQVLNKGTYFKIDVDAIQGGVTLPFIENFEAIDPGPLDGENNWHADTPANVEVQTSVKFNGARAAKITDAYAWHGVADGTYTNVWIDWYARPVPRSAVPRGISELTVDTTASFYVNRSGAVVALSNGTWITTTGYTVTTGEWARFSVHLDYDAHTWTLYAADNTPNRMATRVARGMPFYSTGSAAVVSFRMTEDSASGSSYIDDFVIGSTMPLCIDNDGDGISDRWELYYIGNTNSDADADSDNDGLLNLPEYLAGTDPTNDASYVTFESADLVDAASQNVVFKWPIGTFAAAAAGAYTNVGDRIQRSYSILAANTAGGDRTPVATLAEVTSGTNTWVETNAVTLSAQRYYTIRSSVGGTDGTGTVEWAMYAQPRIDAKLYLVSVPVDLGAGNNLNGTLGDQLARGLHGGNSGGSQALLDMIYIRTTNNVWKEYYLVTNGTGEALWWDYDIGELGDEADLAVTPGMGFLVKRRSGTPRDRTNCVFVGKSHTSAQALHFTTNNASDGWAFTLFGWPFATPKHHQNLGPGTTPANQLGFSAQGYGGTSGLFNKPHEQQGDQIWVWEGNTFEHKFWLADGISADVNGRWIDPETGQIADFSLVPGRAYWYRHHVATNGAATGAIFNWTPTE